jgi:diguanylate cyclase (GGDEF)-like protein
VRTSSRDARRPDGLLQLALAAAVVLLATSLVRFTVSRFGYQPTLSRLHSAQLAEDAANKAMLDMETGVRGYQLGADDRFLAPYTSGHAAYPTAVRTVHARLTELPDALALWKATDVAASAWQSAYAAHALAAVSPTSRPSVTNLLAGKRLFDDYRTAEGTAAATLTSGIERREASENLFRTTTGLVQLAALALLAFILVRRQRRPHEARTRREGLAVSAAGAGWQDAFGPTTADPARLATSITDAAREISGALSAALWLAEDDGELRRVDPGQPVITAQRRRHDVALRAHREGAITTSTSRSRRTVAVPLLHEGRTLGVVELEMPAGSGEPTHAQTEMLRAWGRHAAQAVIQGAGSRDRLTGFGGRGALDADLASAVERSLAYEKSVSVVVLDIDHLERHSAASSGLHDELIRTVGTVLSDTVRTTDTAYRTGDGSFAVLLPGAPLPAATSLAERLRQIIARRFVERGVTVSFGVASSPDIAEDAAGLLEAAESALYDAQKFGGNRAQAARPLGDELELVRRRSSEID